MVNQRPEILTVNGVEYVPKADFDAVLEEKGKYRRTLALAHMHLCFSEEEQALARIVADTGDGIEDARSIRSLVEWARTEGNAHGARD